MSDQTFGRAAREEWDRLEYAANDAAIMAAIERVSSAIGKMEDAILDGEYRLIEPLLDAVEKDLAVIRYRL